MRLPIILDWLANNSTDVLCIQETKAQDIDFPVEDINQAGYNCVFKGQKSYNGVAILSPHEIENAKWGLDDEPADRSRIIAAKIKGVNIVNTYIPQGRDVESDHFEYKLQWFKRLKKYFNNHYAPSDDIVWVGDLNVAPTAIDVHNPKRLEGHVCYCPQVREALADIAGWGFEDIFRKYYKDTQEFTYWDYRVKNAVDRGVGWRIDHVMATKSIAKKSTACYVDKEPRKKTKPSDHTFLIAEFHSKA